MPSELLSYSLTLGWLGILTSYDLRLRELPHWGTTAPLLLAGLLRLVYPPGDAQGLALWLARSAMLLLLCLVLGSDFTPLIWVFSATALVLAVQTRQPALLVLVATWIMALLWTQWGIWGGGDAKVVMILVALWPELRLVGALLFALFVGGVLALRQRYGHALPAVLADVLTRLRQGQVPAQEADTAPPWTHQPGVPWLLVGTLLYSLGRLLLWT